MELSNKNKSLEGTNKTYEQFVNAVNSSEKLDTDFELALDKLKEAIINEIKCGKIELYFKGKQLDESETIYQSGLKNNDIVDVRDINEGHRIEEAFVIKREAPIETKEINNIR